MTTSKGNAASVESIIKSMYTDLLDKLNLPQLCDHLYEKNMITDDIKERIEKATCRDANKLYVDHLKANHTISTLKQFSQLLVDTSLQSLSEVSTSSWANCFNVEIVRLAFKWSIYNLLASLQVAFSILSLISSVIVFFSYK